MNDATTPWVDPELIAAGKLFPIQVSAAEKTLFRNLNEPHDLREMR